MAKVGPHIRNAQYRKINEDILADIDEFIKAKFSNKECPQQLHEMFKRAHKAFAPTM